MKAHVLPDSGDPVRVSAAALDVGLVDVRAEMHHVDLGLRHGLQVVAYRLAMPHIAPWVAALEPPALHELVRRAVSAVAPMVGTWRPGVIVLSGRVKGQPRRRVAWRSSASA
jgi:hypothetical protein